MNKIVILSFLIFSPPLFAMEKVGYPLGLIACSKNINIYQKIDGKNEKIPCEKLFSLNYDSRTNYIPILVYKRKSYEKDWYQVFTIKGEERWIPVGTESIHDARFSEFREIVGVGLYRFNPKWDKKIYEDPQRGQVIEVKKKPYEVEIIENKFFDGKLWVKINLYDGSKCINEDEKPPKLIHSGWVPFMRTNTESNFEKPFECG